MEWGFILGLVVIASVLIGLIVLLGRRFSKFMESDHPESDFAVSVTPAGNVLFGGMVGFWGACLTAYKLAPQSALGIFVSTADGVITAIGGSIVVFAIAMVVLEKLGHPCVKRKGRGT